MKIKIKDLTLMAIYLALFVVLDFISNSLPIFKMPQGGTLGLGVVALLLASYHLGWKEGLIVAFSSVIMQFITGQMYIVHPIQFILDYMIAFPVYALASTFPKYYGVIITNTIRYLCHVISGIVFFGSYAGNQSVVMYSLIYNAWYMIPTTIVSLIIVSVVMKRVKRS